MRKLESSSPRRPSRPTGSLPWLVLAAVLAGGLVAAEEAPLEEKSREAIEAFLDDVATRHGFDRAVLEKLFRRVRIRRDILEIVRRPSQRSSWPAYRARFVNAERIEGGVRFYRRHAELLARAARTYGVPGEVVTAIIGIETHYGRQTGRFRVLDALTTLAFHDPRRPELFRRELEEYLLLVREEKLPALDTKGSYAGAIGIAQFLPGSYRRFGVDFDGDGRRDLLGSPADAIGSVANYLRRHGWHPDAPVVVAADVESRYRETLVAAGLDAHFYVEALRRLGVRPRGEIPGHYEGRLFRLEGDEGEEYFVGLASFRALTRYNRSTYYAMAVHELSEAIAERLATTAAAP